MPNKRSIYKTDSICPACQSGDLRIEAQVLVAKSADGSWSVKTPFDYSPDAYAECAADGCDWSGIYDEAVDAAKEFYKKAAAE